MFYYDNIFKYRTGYIELTFNVTRTLSNKIFVFVRLLGIKY